LIKIAQTLLSITQQSKPVRESGAITEEYAQGVILENLMKLSKSEAKCFEQQVELEKLQTQLMLGKEHASDLKGANAELAAQVDELTERLAQLNRESKARDSQKNLGELLE
jgi:polyhydroxyalkanoate synthesis regulator phasin